MTQVDCYKTNDEHATVTKHNILFFHRKSHNLVQGENRFILNDLKATKPRNHLINSPSIFFEQSF